MAASHTSLAEDPNERDPLTNSLSRQLQQPGFAFVSAAEMKSMLSRPEPLADWRAFADSWNDLPRDLYLPDGHRYRRRRHATFSSAAGEQAPRLEPHRPHYQSREYNPHGGGMGRWFEPARTKGDRG